MKKIILIGAGGHCTSCIDVIELEKKFKIVGLIDNKRKKPLFTYKILGNDKQLTKINKKKNYVLITLGQINEASKREKLYKYLLKLGYKFPTIISPLAYVSKKAKIGKGTIIMHGSIINAGAKIGNNCIVNSKALIEHDVVVGDNCHISTNSTINGGVEIFKNSFLGSNSVIKQNTVIGKNSFINANLFINKVLKNNSKIYK